MGTWWITTIGFVLCIGFIAGTMFHFLSGALNTDDTKRIDPIKENNDDGLD